MKSITGRAVEASADYAERCRNELKNSQQEAKLEKELADVAKQEVAKAAAQRSRAEQLEKLEYWRDTVAQLDRGRNFHRRPECVALLAAMKNQETAESNRRTGIAALQLNPDVFLTRVGLRAMDKSQPPEDEADDRVRLTTLTPAQAASLDLDELSSAVHRHIAEYATHGHTDALCDARDATAELTLDKRAARNIRLATLGGALLVPALGLATRNIGLLLGAAPLAGVGALLGSMVGFGPDPAPIFPENPDKPSPL